VTIQNLEVADVSLEKNLLLVKGAIPGANGGLVIILPAVKHKKKAHKS
jgi:large subunit ribosomal protein L3